AGRVEPGEGRFQAQGVSAILRHIGRSLNCPNRSCGSSAGAGRTSISKESVIVVRSTWVETVTMIRPSHSWVVILALSPSLEISIAARSCDGSPPRVLAMDHTGLLAVG